jgi:hypothetical protein
MNIRLWVDPAKRIYLLMNSKLCRIPGTTTFENLFGSCPDMQDIALQELDDDAISYGAPLMSGAQIFVKKNGVYYLSNVSVQSNTSILRYQPISFTALPQFQFDLAKAAPLPTDINFGPAIY